MEVLVFSEVGFKVIEGIGKVYVVGPNQVISTDSSDLLKDQKLAQMEKIWTGPQTEDLRIHGFPSSPVTKEFLETMELYHKGNVGSLYCAVGFYFLSLHRAELHHVPFVNLPTLLIAGDISTGFEVKIN